MRHVIALLALTAQLGRSSDPNPILQPSDYTEWTSTSTDGLSRRADVRVPFVNASGADDWVFYSRGDFVGNARQRGFAHGELFAEEVERLYKLVLPSFIIEMANSLDLSGLPPKLQAAIEAAIVTKAPDAAYRAMQWVWDQEGEFVPPRLLTEMDAMADGLCSAMEKKRPDALCDVEEWKMNIRQVNMFPELIMMTCTMFGAWGQASATGSLFQLRALDFGDSPLSNYSLLQVHRPAPGGPQPPASSLGQWPSPGGQGNDAGDLWQGFASLAFPGLVGALTGVSEKGIGLSEKVWMVYNGTHGLYVQKGHYDGEADVLVMRDVLELAPNRSSAEAYLREGHPNRTFAVFLGVGDRATQQLDIVGYREADFHAYTPETMPAVTGQPFMEDLVYVDKHPQPSGDQALPGLLNASYGAIGAAETAAVSASHETGDLHIAMYDFTPGQETLWFSLGRIDARGHFGPDGVAWKACYRPYIEYPMASLFAGA